MAFAYLVVNRDRPIARDELAEALWGEDLPRTWETSLRVLVSKLRTWLEEAGLDRDAIASSFGTYQLHLPPDLPVDVQEAADAVAAAEAALAAGDPGSARAHATRAASIAAGEFLPGGTGPWVERQQEELRDVRVAALEAVADACLATGDGAAALAAAEEAVGLEPLRESAHLRVMRAHARSGNRADALRAYERVRRTLADELGVSPSPQTEAAYLALLADEPPDADLAAPPPTPPGRSPTRLPTPLSSFVGRAAEVDEVAGLARANRVVTILGTGGLGKTRVAIEVARRVGPERRDGAVLVELAELGRSATADAVADAVLAATGLAEEPGRPPLATLARALAPSDLLVVLDNCEHLVDAAAAVVQAVVEAGPEVTVLATSRERLRLAGEIAWALAPLAPEDAARLFLDRAGVAVAAHDEADLAAICQRLDGLPLAIELAAARADVLSVAQIAARLDDRFRLLTAGARTAPDRQRTLRGALDWSYDALGPAEQALFARLSVFAGPFTLDAAERVAADPDVLDGLAALVGGSLVRTERAAATGEVRYRLLETVRAYAAVKLAADGAGSGDGAAAGTNLLAWAADLAEEAERHLDGPDQAGWLDRLAADHANLRAALAVDTAAPDALRLATALGRFWEVRGHFQEGREWLRTIVADASGTAPPLLMARAHNAAANLAQRQGDYAAARSRLEASLALRRDAGDRLGAAIALLGLGNLAALQQDYAGAQDLYEQSRAVGVELGDDRLVAAALGNLGWVAHTAADLAGAARWYGEALAIRRRTGDQHGIALTLGQLGDLAYQRGDYDEAEARHGESLDLRTRLGDRAGRADSLATLGHLALGRGDLTAARARFEESKATREEIGDRSTLPQALLNLADLAVAAGDLDGARSCLDEAAAAAESNRDTAGLAHVLVHRGRVERLDGDATEAARRYAAASGSLTGGVRAEWLEGVAATVGGPAGARLLAAAHRLREETGSPLPPHERPAYDRDVETVRAALGDAAFKKAWKAGLAMSADAAVEESGAALGLGLGPEA